MISPLYSMVYVSTSCLDADVEQQKQDIEQIIKVSQKNNAERSVTGALLFSGGYFCQVIEGEKKTLEELYALINLDPRHKDSYIISFDPIQHRHFEQWDMALVTTSHQDDFGLADLIKKQTQISANGPGKVKLSIIENMLKTLERKVNE